MCVVCGEEGKEEGKEEGRKRGREGGKVEEGERGGSKTKMLLSLIILF